MKIRKFKLAGAAVQGLSHVKSGVPCQDKYYIKVMGKHCALAALADGAGSAKCSQDGAAYVVQNILPIIKDSFNKNLENEPVLATTIVSNLQEGLNRLALELECTLNDLACTLLFVFTVIRKKSVHYFAGHLGDGVIAAFNGKNSYVLSHPARGEFANTTYFITGQNASSHLRIYNGIIPGNAGFMLMSDGTSDSLYLRKNQTLAPACNKIFQWANRYSSRQLSKFLEMNLRMVFTK